MNRSVVFVSPSTFLSPCSAVSLLPSLVVSLVVVTSLALSTILRRELRQIFDLAKDFKPLSVATRITLQRSTEPFQSMLDALRTHSLFLANCEIFQLALRNRN